MAQTRQLAAIMFTDIVGYTALMQRNEQQAATMVKRYIAVLQKSVSEYAGNVLNDYGDGSLCTFSSATQAVQCAVVIQQQLQTDLVVPLRIGLHIGELFFQDGKVLGDGVNVASRIQSLGQANTILFSKEIFDKIRNQPEFKSLSLGLFEFKNVEEPMEVFVLANDGLIIPKREQLEGKLKKKNSSKRKLIIASALFVLVIGSVFLYYKFFNDHPFTVKDKSIAILPFKIMGSNKDNLGEGLVDDIQAYLSKIKELKVISNRSSAKYTNNQKSEKEISEELHVTSLVTGSIQQNGNRIKVSAQLIDGKTGNTIWADFYDREIIQVFDLETEVATKIVTALKAKLTPEEKIGLSKRYTENVEAYKLYITGRSFWNIRDPSSLDSAEVYYKRALQLDSNYALAYAGLSYCYVPAKRGLSPFSSIAIARVYASKALSIDSNLSEALTSIGYIQQIFEYDWANSKENLKKAIDFDPNNPIAHIFYGNVLQYTGNTKEGLSEARKAVELDPQSFVTNWILGRNYYFAGEYDMAIKQLQRTYSISTNQSNKDIVNWSLGLVYLEKKLYPQAENVFNMLSITKDFQLDDNQIMQSYAYAVMGDKPKANELLEKTLKEKSHQLPYRLAQVYIVLNNFSEAMNQLELGYEIRDSHMFWIKVDQAFDPIRNYPRFKELMKKMHLE